MSAPKGNQNAKGNKGGGRKTSYKPEYAEQAQKLCAIAGFTDQMLAESLPMFRDAYAQRRCIVPVDGFLSRAQGQSSPTPLPWRTAHLSA